MSGNFLLHSTAYNEIILTIRTFRNYAHYDQGKFCKELPVRRVDLLSSAIPEVICGKKAISAGVLSIPMICNINFLTNNTLPVWVGPGQTSKSDGRLRIHLV